LKGEEVMAHCLIGDVAVIRAAATGRDVISPCDIVAAMKHLSEYYTPRAIADEFNRQIEAEEDARE
jgi:hypothetical protein